MTGDSDDSSPTTIAAAPRHDLAWASRLPPSASVDRVRAELFTDFAGVSEEQIDLLLRGSFARTRGVGIRALRTLLAEREVRAGLNERMLPVRCDACLCHVAASVGCRPTRELT